VRYHNLNPDHRPHAASAIFRWGGRAAPLVEPDLALIHRGGDRPRITWLGHAGFLISVSGRHFLIDPLMSRRVARVYPNFVAAPLAPSDWPPIDAVLITHNHYDHLDRTALRALPSEVPALVPSGLGSWFARWNRRPVRELAWWQTEEMSGVGITLVPSRHWSRRGVLDVNRSHWGGFVLESSGHSVYHAGDSAWFDGFAEIRRRFPGLSAAMLPIGAYEPGWFMENNHLNPEQACRAFLETGARALVPMHWGSIRLTDETLSEPIQRVESWWRDNDPRDGRQLARMDIGETLIVENQ
jgi:L-ascorbate metabolism protein UlaG (beta-lactamase superfamily)